MLFYGAYLLAYVFLEHTYRLGKLAISTVWPLATLALLPVLLWGWQGWRSRFPRKAPAIALFLLSVHTVLHLEKAESVQSRVVGQLQLTGWVPAEVERIVLSPCENRANYQFYGRLAGLRLAREFPELAIEVNGAVAESGDLAGQTPRLVSETLGTLHLSGKNLTSFEDEDFDGIQGCRYRP